MVDRRSVVRGKHKSFGVRVTVRGLRAGNHQLSVRARDRKGRSARKTAVFRVCRTAAARFAG
jgi:hypothetical protein